MSDLRIACPKCSQHIQCDSYYVGKEIDCPACKTRILVTAPEPC